MTESLQNAFSLASQFSDNEQDTIAAWLVSELESERKWDTAFRESQDTLLSLAQEALSEHAKNETKDWKTN